MPLAASTIRVRRRFLAARDVRVLRFHLPGQHDQQTHGDGGSVDVYHGTADTLVASILKEGIVPGKERSGDKWAAENGWTSIIASHEGRALSVYVSTHDDGAKSFSEYAAQVRPGAVPVLLKLSVPRSVYDSFKQDEQGGSTLKRFEGALKPEYIVGYKIPVRGKWSGEYTPVSNREWMEEHKQLYLLIFASATAKFSRPTPSRAASRVNFAAIKQREDALARTAVPEAANAVARGVRRMLGDDEQLASLLDDDPQDIAALAMNGVDVGRVRAAFDGALETAYETGRVTGANELTRAGRPESFAALREKAAGYIAANGFRMAENVSEATRAIIQAELLTGVKVGKRPAVVREAIWDALVRKGLTSRAASLGVETDEAVVGALNALWVDEEEDAAHYLDTLVRTNSFEAMNEARFEEFTDAALGGFVQALEYSAILDDNTTEICTHLDGRIYAAQSDVWDIYRPPNHYNCRSLLIPVTAIDGWDGVESDAPSVEPQAGFFTRCTHAEHFHLPGGHDQSTHGHGGGESDQRIGDRPVFDAGGDSASYVHQTHSSAVESITKNGLRPSDGQYGKAVYLADSAKANIGRGYTDIALDVRLKEGTRAVEVSGLTAFYKLVESVGTPADATDPGPYLVKAGLDAVKVKQLDGSSYMIVYNPSAITVAKVRG